MKIERYIAGVALSLVVATATAQRSDYAAFLSSVAERSPQLSALQRGHEATVRGLRTGLAPDDPEVGLEYYFAGETRYELTVEQTFDFPTVYHQRNKISKLGITKAEREYGAARRAILEAVSEAYLRLNYAAGRVSILTQRRDEMRRAIGLYEEGLATGEGSVLELRNAQMMLTGIENDLTLAETERAEASATLAQLNGGTEIVPQGYPQFGFTGTEEEFVAAALAADYALQAAAIDTLIAQRELKLSRHEWIPKLKVGYKAEVEGSRGTNALLAGISLPLWQNSGRTRHARALEVAASAQHAATEAEARTRLHALYRRHRSLSAALTTRRDEAAGEDYPALLREAAAAGQITSIDALMGLEGWYAMRDSLAELELEVARTAAAMALCLID